MSVWRQRGAAAGAGLQSDAAAAELSGAVGLVAGRGGHRGPEALRAEPQRPAQGCQGVPAQLVLLQVRGGQNVICQSNED